MTKSILEVIVCTVEDALEAAEGGADRLEVVRRLDVGGLTPSPDLVRRIKAEVSLPLRVMIRESASFEASSDAEIEKLCSSVKTFSEIGVDGIVFGFLKGDEPDFALVKFILSVVPEMKATFHHAFEATRDKISFIKALRKFPQVDRILAHGGTGSWTEKIGRLGQYQEAALPEVTVITGGGLDLEVMKLIQAGTSINEFHFGTAARVDGRVNRACVAELASLIQ